MQTPELIDVHVHVFPQNVMDRIWRYFDQHHWPIYYRTSEAERTAVLERELSAYTTLCYAHRPGMALVLGGNARRLYRMMDTPSAMIS